MRAKVLPCMFAVGWLVLAAAATPSLSQEAGIDGWLHLLETHQHRLLGARLRSLPAGEREPERHVLMVAMSGADLVVGRPLTELPTLEDEALPGLMRSLGEEDDASPLWRAAGLRTLAAAATLRGEVWRARWQRWRAKRAERAVANAPDRLMGIGADHYARWWAGEGDGHLAAARRAFEGCAEGGELLAGVARVMALHVAREEGDWRGVVTLASPWKPDEIRHPLALWAVGVAEREVALRAATSQEAIFHLGRSAKYLSRLRFQVRSLAWPHYQRGLTLMALYPRQRNEPDRYRTLEAAQHAFEAYLTARETDPVMGAEAHYRLGFIAEERGRKVAARSHYALAAGGGHARAQARLEALKQASRSPVE